MEGTQAERAAGGAPPRGHSVMQGERIRAPPKPEHDTGAEPKPNPLDPKAAERSRAKTDLSRRTGARKPRAGDEGRTGGPEGTTMASTITGYYCPP